MESQHEQMTLQVGPDDGQTIIGSFRVGGSLAAIKELPKGADVRVVVTDTDGEIVATGLGYIGALAFKEHRPKDAPFFTERAHSVKVVD